MSPLVVFKDKRGMALPMAVMLAAVGLIAFWASTEYLLQSRRLAIREVTDARVGALEASISRIINNPALCTMVLKNQSKTGNLTLNLGGAYQVPLRATYPSAPDNEMAELLKGLQVQEIRFVPPAATPSSLTGHLQVKLFRTPKTIGSGVSVSKTIGSSISVLKFPLTITASGSTITGCAGGAAAQPNDCSGIRFLNGVAVAGGSGYCNPPNMRLGILCPAGTYLWGFKFRTQEPNCQPLPFANKACNPSTVKGFDSTGHPLNSAGRRCT